MGQRPRSLGTTRGPQPLLTHRFGSACVCPKGRNPQARGGCGGVGLPSSGTRCAVQGRTGSPALGVGTRRRRGPASPQAGCSSGTREDVWAWPWHWRFEACEAQVNTSSEGPVRSHRRIPLRARCGTPFGQVGCHVNVQSKWGCPAMVQIAWPAWWHSITFDNGQGIPAKKQQQHAPQLVSCVIATREPSEGQTLNNNLNQTRLATSCD